MAVDKNEMVYDKDGIAYWIAWTGVDNPNITYPTHTDDKRLWRLFRDNPFAIKPTPLTEPIPFSEAIAKLEQLKLLIGA